MADDSIMVLNDYGLTRRDRTNASGAVKSRYTVTFKSEPLLINTDPRSLTKAPADAIAEFLKDRIRGLAGTIPKNTLKAREAAERAVDAGKAWALRRYGGGRTGLKEPNQSSAPFNDSGRFADSIAVGATKDGWVVNVAANRFDPTTSRGVQAIFDRLRELVPEFGDSRALTSVLSVRRALQQSVDNGLRKAQDRGVELQKQLMRQALGIARSILG